MYDCVIVGAGISGLSAAYELMQHGQRVLVVEASSEPGGAMRSERREGFVVENGPNTVVSRSAALHAHFAALGIAEQKLVAERSGARRFILKHGRPELIPTSPGALPRTPLLPTAAKLRLLAEPLLPRATTPDESVAMFFARRLGREAAQQLIDPFVSGVYAGDPTELSAQATFPTLWEAEQHYGSIVLGMIAGSRRKPRPAPNAKRPRSEMISFEDGLQTWPHAIAAALGPERIWLDTRAEALAPGADSTGWQLTVQRTGQPAQTVMAQRVVLATPAAVTGTLVAALSSTAAAALAAIPSPPMAVVHLGYRRADVGHPLDGFGVLCPSREQRRILGSLWSSTLFPRRAPEGFVLTTAFVGGARYPELALQDDEELIEMVIAEQRGIIDAHGDPTFAHVARWERAIPQYTVGHMARMAALNDLEARWAGLHIMGNVRDGVSVEKCWNKGHELGRMLAHETGAA